MVDDHVERVRSALLPLCEPLHDVFTLAEQLRRGRHPELADDPSYRWYATHTVRAFAHHRLSQLKGKLGRWVLSGNHAQNGALWLTDSAYRVRLLHALNDTDVPPPGPNGARRAFYCNPHLPLNMPMIGDPNDRLITLWRIDPKTAAPSFRVVRPIGEWRFGAHAHTDLDFILPPTADELADLAFEPTDEDLGLDVPREEEGDSDAGGITG